MCGMQATLTPAAQSAASRSQQRHKALSKLTNPTNPGRVPTTDTTTCPSRKHTPLQLHLTTDYTTLRMTAGRTLRSQPPHHTHDCLLLCRTAAPQPPIAPHACPNVCRRGCWDFDRLARHRPCGAALDRTRDVGYDGGHVRGRARLGRRQPLAGRGGPGGPPRVRGALWGAPRQWRHTWGLAPGHRGPAATYVDLLDVAGTCDCSCPAAAAAGLERLRLAGRQEGVQCRGHTDMAELSDVCACLCQRSYHCKALHDGWHQQSTVCKSANRRQHDVRERASVQTQPQHGHLKISC